MAEPMITIFDFPASVIRADSSIIAGLYLIATIAGEG